MNGACAFDIESERTWCEIDAITCDAEPAGTGWDWCTIEDGEAKEKPDSPREKAANAPETTNGGCQCLPWTHMGQTFPASCFNPTGDVGGSWCYVDPRTCATPPFSPHSIAGAWDYCTRPPALTASGCTCKNKWAPFDGAPIVPGRCEDVDKNGEQWCVVDE